jgi:hypothetical protein
MKASPVSDDGLKPTERAFFEELNHRGVKFLLVGMGAAIIEGAPVTTVDLDVWFGNQPAWDEIRAALGQVGGFYSPGSGLHPPMLGGPGLERLDLVLHAHGLDTFEEEYTRSREYKLAGLKVRVLPLERVIVSKRAAWRPKDQAAIPALEAALAAKRTREA